MEAREFSRNGPMAEIVVSGSPEEWKDIINDIIEAGPEGASLATVKLFTILDQMGLV